MSSKGLGDLVEANSSSTSIDSVLVSLGSPDPFVLRLGLWSCPSPGGGGLTRILGELVADEDIASEERCEENS